LRLLLNILLVLLMAITRLRLAELLLLLQWRLVRLAGLIVLYPLILLFLPPSRLLLRGLIRSLWALAFHLYDQ
jgi:hypothetical protein